MPVQRPVHRQAPLERRRALRVAQGLAVVRRRDHRRSARPLRQPVDRAGRHGRDQRVRACHALPPRD